MTGVVHLRLMGGPPMPHNECGKDHDGKHVEGPFGVTCEDCKKTEGFKRARAIEEERWAAFRATATVDEFKTALVALGANVGNDAWAESWIKDSFGKFKKGDPVVFCVQDERLGRCYSRSTYVALNGTEKDIPKGNFGNYRVLGRGEHRDLGPWLKASTEYDSSD